METVEIAVSVAAYAYELVVLTRNYESRCAESGFVTVCLYSTKRIVFANAGDEGEHVHFTGEAYVENLDVTLK